MFGNNNKLYYENDKYKFYTNFETKSLTEYAHRENFQGVKLDKWFVLLAVPKDNNRVMFILCDDNGGIVDEGLSYEKIGSLIDIYKAIKS